MIAIIGIVVVVIGGILFALARGVLFVAIDRFVDLLFGGPSKKRRDYDHFNK